jgi:hypothetical protein
LVQAALAAVIVASAFVAMMRGGKNKREEEEPHIRQAQMYFDGPLVSALRLLENIDRTSKEILEEARRGNRDTLTRTERIQEVLRDIRGNMIRESKRSY